MAFYDVDPSLLAGLKEPDPEKKKKWLGGLLDADPNSPAAQGLLGMAAQMLQASGPSRTPVSFGQALGSGLQGMQQGRANATQEGFKREALDIGRDRVNSPNAGPMSVQEWKYFQTLSPEEQKMYLEMKRNPNIINLGGTQAVRAPGGGIGESYRVTPKPEQMPSFQASQESAKSDAKYRAELGQGRSKTESGIEATGVKTDMLTDLINKAKDQAGFFTTGAIGQTTKGIGGTPAHDLSNTLDTIKANIGFDRLQEMRANSKTGGALGAVSERENKLLQSVWGALEQSQSERQFKQNLDLVNKQVKESWRRVRDAYRKDYGTEYKEEPRQSNTMSIDELLKKY